ncbi:MAG: DUF1097 domain-containing protein [Nocardioidaceae bacterium]
MKALLGIGISVGVLAGVWTYVSVELGLITWVAFIAWACFFAAGGGTEGLRKGLAANLAGVAWGYLISLVLELNGSTIVLALAVTVVGFILCVQAAWSVLSFIPGAFAGTAVFFGTAFDLWGTVLALVIGAALGLASALLGDRIQAAVDGGHRQAASEGSSARA